MTAVKNKRATTAAVDKTPSDRQKKRFLKLIDEMGAERGYKHGWKSAVARELGLSQSYVSRLSDQSRNSVGIDAIENAKQKLKLHHEYFDGPNDPKSYHDFVRRGHPYPEWERFLETEKGRSMSRAERETLGDIRLKGYQEHPSVGLYTAFLIALRGELQDPEGVRRTARKYDELDDEVRRRRARRLPSHPTGGHTPDSSE